MASIQTGIQLQDGFTNVIMGLINSVNIAISSMEGMNRTMSADVDTSSLQAAREELAQVTIAANELNAAFESVKPPEVKWQSDNTQGMLIDANGIERYKQELQQTDVMLQSLNDKQIQLNVTASSMDILPTAAQNDLATVRDRIQSIILKMQQMENDHVDINMGAANTSLENLRGQLNQALQEQNNLNHALQEMDIQEANSAYMRLSQAIGNAERNIRDNVTQQQTFNDTIQQGSGHASNLAGMIKRAVGTYATLQSIKGAIGASDDLTQTTARLNLMNDGVQSTDDLVNMVYASAQNARGSFGDMAAVVARFGNNAKDAFDSSAEAVQFANLVQKQMTIAGASTRESSNAMLQLSQALGSGVLRGDELNSVFDQAPNLIQNIADYMNVPVGKIREMAQEGKISANVVKAAIFSAADDINSKFESMPMTWGQLWTSFQNEATKAFQPVLQRLNDMPNNQSFQTFVTNVVNDMAIIAGVVSDILDGIGQVGTFIGDNWSAISPVVYGIGAALLVFAACMGAVKLVTLIATAAQWVYNTALLACPLTWIIALIAVAIGVIIALANHFSGAGHVAKSAFGAICGAVNVAIQFFKNLGLTVANIALGIGNALGAVGKNIVTAFSNAIKKVQSFFYELLSVTLLVIERICAALNELPFIEFDYSGVSNAAMDYARKSVDLAKSKDEYTSVADAFNNGMSTYKTFQKNWVDNAYRDGANWGDKATKKVKDYFSSKATKMPKKEDYINNLPDNKNIAAATAANTAKTAANTKKTADALSTTAEDLKYIRDMAERSYVNRYTTTNIKISQTNHNKVSSDMDLDGVTEHLRSTLEKQMAAFAEGVH